MNSEIYVLQNAPFEFLEETIRNVVAFVPRLVGALAILLIGWAVGIALGKVVRKLVDRVELDRMVLDTPLGRILGGTERAVSSTFGSVTKWFVVALAVLAAADVLAIQLLSQWIQTAVSYLPAFIAGLAVIVIGFVVADFIGDAIARTRASTESNYTSAFATGTRMFLYFTAIVIGLDTMGIDVSILYVFANAIAWGLAAALALGAGIALGWGGHNYVEKHIDRWVGEATPESGGSGGAGRTSSTRSSTRSGPEEGTGVDEEPRTDSDDVPPGRE